MKKRHPNHRLVKIHRNYTVEEIAELFNIHKNTVRSWIKTGLATCDTKRPMLVLGQELTDFLISRREKNKQTCKPGELFCVGCKAPKPPAADMVQYTPVTEKFGNLTAICPDCNAIMNQRVSLAKLGEVCRNLELSLPEALRHIIEMSAPTINSDFNSRS